jgi:hypothetical protein
VEALLVEGRHLGYGVEQLVELLKECDRSLKGRAIEGQGAQS